MPVILVLAVLAHSASTNELATRPKKGNSHRWRVSASRLSATCKRRSIVTKPTILVCAHGEVRDQNQIGRQEGKASNRREGEDDVDGKEEGECEAGLPRVKSVAVISLWPLMEARSA